MDCILEGIKSDSQAKSGPYRELVRNTCGMFGVPPNYMSLRYEDNYFFGGASSVVVGINLANGTLRTDRENKTSADRPDCASIREEEELPRKHLFLALALLFLLQLFWLHKVIFVLHNFGMHMLDPKIHFHCSKTDLLFLFSPFLNQQWPYIRHFFYPSFKFMVVQILFLVLVLLICILCKSLTFGQIRLFSPDRTIFRGDWQVLPVLRDDLPKMGAESQVSFVTYLLNPPKLAYDRFPNYVLKKNVTNKVNSDNIIIYHPRLMGTYMIFVLPCYMLVWSLAVGLTVICIVVKTIQITHLLIQGKLFAYTPRHRPTGEERWNSLLAKVDKICYVAEKKVKIDELQDIKIVRDWEKEDNSVSELNKREKTD